MSVQGAELRRVKLRAPRAVDARGDDVVCHAYGRTGGPETGRRFTRTRRKLDTGVFPSGWLKSMFFRTWPHWARIKILKFPLTVFSNNGIFELKKNTIPNLTVEVPSRFSRNIRTCGFGLRCKIKFDRVVHTSNCRTGRFDRFFKRVQTGRFLWDLNSVALLGLRSL